MHSLKQKVAAWLRLARISNAPTVVTNVMAGAGLATGGSLPTAPVVRICIAMVLFYTAGMFLNDLCDRENDRRERPERPLPAGLLTPGAVLGGVILFFGAGLELLWPLGNRVFSFGLILVLFITVYDLWHRGNPAAPLLMALCRGVVYAAAYFAFSSQPTFRFFLVSGFLVFYVAALTMVARAERYRPALGKWIAPLIAGISLYDALVLFLSGAPKAAFLALFAFPLTLTLQRFVRGT